MSDNLKISRDKKGNNNKGKDGGTSNPLDNLQGRLVIILFMIILAFAALFFKIFMLHMIQEIYLTKEVIYLIETEHILLQAKRFTI